MNFYSVSFPYRNFFPTLFAALGLFTICSCSHGTDSGGASKTAISKPAPLVFRSADEGETWQDISEGLPQNVEKDSIRGRSFFANDKGLFLKVDGGVYQSSVDVAAPVWAKSMAADEQ